MTRILLIRHGQASFGSDDYDRLSELGEEQSRHLGRHLAALPHEPGAVYSGTLRRQQQTADLALTAYGADTPPVENTPAFNEYHAGPLFEAYLDRVLEQDPELNRLGEAVLRQRRAFQRAFEGVMRCWLADPEPPPPVPESWPGFRSRVTEGLERIARSHGKDDTIHVYTSGGVIAVGVAAALELSPLQTVMLNWRVYNGSITELTYGRRGWSLMGFNAVDHFALKEPERLLTFR